MSNVFEIVSNYCISKRNQTFFDYAMKKRGWSSETIDQWGLGYFPPDSLLDLKIKVKENGLTIDALEAVSFVSNWGIKGFKSKFFGRVVFPVWNEFGEYIAMTGRAIDGISEPKYFNTTEFDKGTHLYGLNHAIESIRENDLVYVFEGNADVVTAHQHGIKNSVCVMGTAFREDHLIVLSRYASRIILVFDNDEGGRRAISSFNERGFDKNKSGVKVYLGTFAPSEFKDADAYISAMGKDSFIDLINKTINDASLQNQLRSIKKSKKGR